MKTFTERKWNEETIQRLQAGLDAQGGFRLIFEPGDATRYDITLVSLSPVSTEMEQVMVVFSPGQRIETFAALAVTRGTWPAPSYVVEKTGVQSYTAAIISSVVDAVLNGNRELLSADEMIEYARGSVH